MPSPFPGGGIFFWGTPMGTIRSIVFFLLSGVMLGGLARADSCSDGLGGLSEEEVGQILPQLDIDGDRDLVAFNCRDPRQSSRIILATHVGSNFGGLFRVTFAAGKAEVLAVETGQFDLLQLLKDRSGDAFLLVQRHYMHRDYPMTQWDMLVDFRTGKAQPLAEASEDGTSGWCGNETTAQGEEEEPAAYDTASEMTRQLEARPDGLKNIRYTIQTKDCRSKKMTTQTLHYLPGKSGFSLEK